MGSSLHSSPVLTLDLGNTSLKVLLWEQGKVVQRWRAFPDSGRAGDLLPTLEGPLEVRGVRVRRGAERLIPPSWPPVLWAGEALELPGKVLYRDPSEMGADRRVAAWAAKCLCGQGLVLDCGTALTLTHIDSEGRIQGLGISSGYGTLRSGLAQAAPALASFLEEDVPPPDGVPGGSAENLSHGMEQGWSGLLRQLLEEARRLVPDPGPLLLCGSDAELAARLLGEGEVQPDLLHVGLLALARSS